MIQGGNVWRKNERSTKKTFNDFFGNYLGYNLCLKTHF